MTRTHASHSTPDTPATPPVLQVEEIAVQIEDPFGSKANDLPLEAYTLAVQADVLRLLDEASIGASSRGLAAVSYTHLTLPTIYSV